MECSAAVATLFFSPPREASRMQILLNSSKEFHGQRRPLRMYYELQLIDVNYIWFMNGWMNVCCFAASHLKQMLAGLLYSPFFRRVASVLKHRREIAMKTTNKQTKREKKPKQCREGERSCLPDSTVRHYTSSASTLVGNGRTLVRGLLLSAKPKRKSINEVLRLAYKKCEKEFAEFQVQLAIKKAKKIVQEER